MRKFLLVIVLILFAFSCFKCNKRSIKNHNFVFKDSLHVVVDSFLQKYPNKKIYELYINKESPFDFVMWLYGGDSSLTIRENTNYHQYPIIKVNFRGKVIYVYSGAERYIGKKNEEINNKFISDRKLTNKSYQGGVCWVIINHKNKIKIFKNYDYTPYPFIGTPIPIIPILKTDSTNK